MLEKRRAFTLIEVIIVIGILAIVAIIAFFNLQGGQNQAGVNSTAQQASALLRQAQVSAFSQKNNTAWGVYFSNATNTAPFYALISSSTYSTSSVVAKYTLPSTVAFTTSTIPQGSSAVVVFSPISGAASASIIGIYSVKDPSITQNILVNLAGAVSLGSNSLAQCGSTAFHIYVSTGLYIDEYQCSGNTVSLVNQFGGQGSGAGQFQMSIAGLTIDSSGNVWVVDGRNGATSTYLDKFSSSGSFISQASLTNPYGISDRGTAWYRNNSFWFGWPGVDTTTVGITCYNYNGTSCFAQKIWGIGGSACYAPGPGAFELPGSVAIDQYDNVWFLDLSTDCIQAFNADDVAFDVTAFGSKGNGVGQFQSPFAIAFDTSSSNIWVTDEVKNAVIGYHFDNNGYTNQTTTYLTQFGSQGSGSGQLQAPEYLAVDANTNIWVNDTGNSRIEEFNASGTYLGQFSVVGGTTFIAIH